MNIADVEKLAELARLAIPQEEKESFLRDLNSILGYINQIEEISVDSNKIPKFDLVNVMREDVVQNETGTYTNRLINEMPEHKDGFLKVKQIL